jgi:NAD(P)-dependent dehydrogenase (short-subunit alcohol dehydrogenase family)
MALAAAGAQVLVHYYRGAAQAGQVVNEIRALGGKAETIGASLNSPEGPHDLARKTRAIVGDRLDILVLNCTSLKEPPLEGVAVEHFDAQLTNNVRAPLFVIQQVLPILGAGSSVVFTLATPSNDGDALAYVTSQGAIQALVPHLAAALVTRGIRVNAVIPPTQTGDVAPAIAFLASSDASWVSGDTLGRGSPRANLIQTGERPC